MAYNHGEKKDAKVLGKLKPIIFGLVCGMTVCLILLLIFALIFSSKDISLSACPIIGYITLGCGALVSGFTCAKLVKQQGFLYGLIGGFTLYLIGAVLSMIVSGFSFSVQGLIKLVIALLCGMIGGIIGVNQKRKLKIRK